jgi:hypothetical protein
MKHSDVETPLLRWWGASLAVTLVAIALIVQWRLGATTAAAAVALAALVLGSVYYGLPRSQRPIYRGFMAITWPIRAVVSLLLLAVIYYGLVTPIGLLLRLVGYDPLDLSPQRRRSSYWQARSSDPSPDSYFRQY